MRECTPTLPQSAHLPTGAGLLRRLRKLGLDFASAVVLSAAVLVLATSARAHRAAARPIVSYAMASSTPNPGFILRALPVNGACETLHLPPPWPFSLFWSGGGHTAGYNG